MPPLPLSGVEDGTVFALSAMAGTGTPGTSGVPGIDAGALNSCSMASRISRSTAIGSRVAR